MIYVASSWRNHFQVAVVAALRAADRQQPGRGLEPYDFKNPPNNTGFHWGEVGMPSYDRETNTLVPFNEYQQALEHPRAIEGFKSDFEAMQASDRCVLVLPCGRSAHLEAGWFAGAGRELYILMADEPTNRIKEDDEMWVVPELMYKMATGVTDSLFDLLGLLGVDD